MLREKRGDDLTRVLNPGSSANSKVLLTTAQVARRYNKTIRTVDRWIADARSNFPKPTHVINGRKHWTEEVLEAYDAACARVTA
jgi:hypothetical protein